MDCQHCEKGFSETSEFEAHTIWHTERQAQLQRGRRRRYSAYKRPRSPSTNPSSNPSPSAPSDHAALDSPPTTTTSSSNKKSQHDKAPVGVSEPALPAFDFDFGTISPIRPANAPSLPTIKSLDDVVARFPAFEIERTDDQSHISRDFKCPDCDAVFSTQKHCDLHNQSKFCPGSAAVIFALYRDMHQPGGYRVDKKNLPFNAYQSSLKCPKCHLTFSNRLLNKVHEHSHVDAHLECLHCQKPFYTTGELDAHYEWHDDMEYRHHRDKCRRKLPGLKLQTKAPPPRDARTELADLGRRSVFLAEEELTAVTEAPKSKTRDPEHNFDQEEELVAISFIGSEDLERIHAPNGVFREVEPEDLNPQGEPPPSSVANALDALEGRSSGSQASLAASGQSADKEDSPGDSEPSSPRPKPTPRRSSIRALFRRTKSDPQLDSDVKKRSSVRRAFRRESASDETLAFDGRSMLNAVLQRVSTAANKGDLGAIRKECDQLMAIRPPTASGPEANLVPVQAFTFPEGTLIHDAAGNQRYISSETVQEITSGLRRLPVATLAKSKVSVLSTRAYLSTQEADFDDAFWCYRAVMELLRQQPMLFPDVIWQAAILSSLAHLAARLNRAEDEEKYYLRGLAISYNRYGRRDLNNINFLRALAAAYEKNDQTGRAAEVYKRSLFARMEISGPGDRDTLMAMQDLAAIYARLGSLTAAGLLYEQCLGGFEVQLTLSHKLTLLIVDRLCDVYIQQRGYEEALALYRRGFPHLRNNFDLDDELPRNWVCRYIQHTPNFDFPPAVAELLQRYRARPSEESLWVLQHLARVSMLAGLLADALETFDFVYNARLRLQGAQSPENLDALHGHCLALECMDRLDAAHGAYTGLIQAALRAPDKNDGKSRVAKLNSRLTALQDRKQALAGEQEAWGLGPGSTGPCQTCKYQTSLLCSRCHLARFCCEACRELSGRSHDQACQPSVTLCQSKSVTAVPGVPPRIEREVLDRLSRQNMRRSGKATLHRVTDTFTLHFDPRNLTTFRVKFNGAVDTFISFDRDADIRFAVMDAADLSSSLSSSSSRGGSGDKTIEASDGNGHRVNGNHATVTMNPAAPPPTSVGRKNNVGKASLSIVREDSGNSTPTDQDDSSSPSALNDGGTKHTGSKHDPAPQTTTTINKPNQAFHWTTPRETESLLVNKDARREGAGAAGAGGNGGGGGGSGGGVFYLLVAPGATMFQGMLERRRKVRRADSAALEGSSLSPMTKSAPNGSMVDYAQGMVLEGVQRTRFAYLVEVAS